MLIISNHFTLQMDDDTVMNIPHMIEFINDELPPYPYNTRIYGGLIVTVHKDNVGTIYPEGIRNKILFQC